MATEEDQAQVKASVLAPSPPATGIRPSRHEINSQETQRYSDQVWLSKQRSSPSLLLYRKLSSDGGRGTVFQEEYDCLDCSSKLHPEPSAGRRIEGIRNTLAQIPGKHSEGSESQLDTPREGVDAGGNRTGSTRCCCTVSSISTSPNISCCHSPKSSPSPGPSPTHSPSLSSTRPHQRHIRRSSLPVSMLPFHKVIKTFISFDKAVMSYKMDFPVTGYVKTFTKY